MLQNEIVKKTPKPQAEVYHLLGLLLYHEGFFKAGLKHLRKAASLKNQPEYFLNLSLALNDLGFYEEGAKAYHKARRLKAGSAEQNWKNEMEQRHLSAGKAYFEKQCFKEALSEYMKVLSFKPQCRAAFLGLALTLKKLGRGDEAIQTIKKILSIEPGWAEARLALAQWYFEDGHIPLAVNEWESVLYQDPANKQARQALLHIQNHPS